MTYRQAEHRAIASMVAILLALVAAAALVTPLLSSPSGRAIPAAAIAPEVCEGHGIVAQAHQIGRVITVTCADHTEALVSAR